MALPAWNNYKNVNKAAQGFYQLRDNGFQPVESGGGLETAAVAVPFATHSIPSSARTKTQHTTKTYANIGKSGIAIVTSAIPEVANSISEHSLDSKPEGVGSEDGLSSYSIGAGIAGAALLPILANIDMDQRLSRLTLLDALEHRIDMAIAEDTAEADAEADAEAQALRTMYASNRALLVEEKRRIGTDKFRHRALIANDGAKMIAGVWQFSAGVAALGKKLEWWNNGSRFGLIGGLIGSSPLALLLISGCNFFTACVDMGASIRKHVLVKKELNAAKDYLTKANDYSASLLALNQDNQENKNKHELADAHIAIAKGKLAAAEKRLERRQVKHMKNALMLVVSGTLFFATLGLLAFLSGPAVLALSGGALAGYCLYAIYQKTRGDEKNKDKIEQKNEPSGSLVIAATDDSSQNLTQAPVAPAAASSSPGTFFSWPKIKPTPPKDSEMLTHCTNAVAALNKISP